MGTLRSLVSNFPPALPQFHLFRAWVWSDEFTEFVFAEMKGLKNVRLVECTHSMVIHFLSLLNKVNDWGGCCILQLFDYWDDEESRMRTQDEIALYIVPLFHLCDPHKTRQFSLQIEEYDEYGTTVSEKLHEACVSLKRDGYAFKIYYRSLEDSPIGEWTMRRVKGHIHCVL